MLPALADSLPALAGLALPCTSSDAIEAYRNALQVRTREQLPQDWAATQNNLGNVLSVLGGLSEGSQASQYLQQAVDAYRSALQVTTRERLSQDWAAGQNNLGLALVNLARRGEEPQASQYLQQAVDAFRSALQVYTHEQLPQNWAAGQSNLGRAFADLAKRSEGSQASQYLHENETVDAYRNALQVYTPSAFAAQWARVTSNLAAAYEAEKDWDNAQECYKKLLSHNPTDQRLQAKIKELSDKL